MIVDNRNQRKHSQTVAGILREHVGGRQTSASGMYGC